MTVAIVLSLHVPNLTAEPNNNRTDKPLKGIDITATKRKDATRFSTPAAVSVVDGEELEKQQLDHLGDVVLRLPNLYLTDFTAITPTMTIRGLGFSDDESDSGSTSVYVDGIPVFSTGLGHLFDIDQFEVLRGPQSTLFGQNSMGGIFAVQTRDPEPDGSGSLRMDVGSNRRLRISGAGDIALGDHGALRIAGGAERSDGQITNTTLNRDDTTGWRSSFGRLKWRLRDSNGGTWKLGLHHTAIDSKNDFFAQAAQAAMLESTATSAGTTNTSFSLITGKYNRAIDHNTDLSISLGANDTSWRYWMPESLFGGRSGLDMRQRLYSAEVRMSHKSASNDWILGLFASRTTRDAPYTFDSSPYYLSETQANIEGNTAAIFGEYGWRPTDAIRIAAGLRFEHNRRQMDWQGRLAGLMDTDADGTPDTPFDMPASANDVKVKDEQLLPRLTLEYTPKSQHFSWLSLARGYKASGFNVYSTQESTARSPYAPELGNHVELGYRLSSQKNDWLVEATVFHTQLRDQQVVVAIGGGQVMTNNAGRSHSTGAELAGRAQLGHTVSISGYAGWVDASFDKYEKGDVDYAGQQFPNTPKYSAGVGANWQPNDRLSVAAHFSRRGSSRLFPNSDAQVSGFNLFDANLSYRFDRFTIGAYGKNLNDSRYFTRALTHGLFVAGAGRTFGLWISADF